MKFLNKNNQNIYQKGFTLIELLVVIAIISLLSSIVMASLNSARQKARDAVRLSDIKQIQTAIEMYISDHGHAPEIGVVGSIDPQNWSLLGNELVPNYISKLPIDPCGYNCSNILFYGYVSPSSNDPASFSEYGNVYGLEAYFESKSGNFIIGNTNALYDFGSS